MSATSFRKSLIIYDPSSAVTTQGQRHLQQRSCVRRWQARCHSWTTCARAASMTSCGKSSPRPSSPEPRPTHEPGNALVPDPLPFLLQLRMDPGRSVGLPRILVHFPDPRRERRVRLGTRRRLAPGAKRNSPTSTPRAPCTSSVPDRRPGAPSRIRRPRQRDRLPGEPGRGFSQNLALQLQLLDLPTQLPELSPLLAR